MAKSDFKKLSRPLQLKINFPNGDSSSSNYNSDDEYQTLSDEKDLKMIQFNYITSQNLMEIIDKKTDDILIVDIRSNRVYQVRHIKYAVNYSCVKKFMSRRSRVRWTRLKATVAYQTIVIYDECDLNEQSHLDALKFVRHLQHDCNDVKLLAGGFSEFMSCCEDRHLERKLDSQQIRSYAQSPTHQESLSSDVMQASLSEIIPDLLYLGNELDARDKDTLLEYRITDIINVTSNVPFYFENKFVYHRLPASDSDKQDISKYFTEAYKIIEAVKKKKGRVFIHCWAGVSRSVSIAIMYLIISKNFEVLDALKYVQERRHIADPNLNFLGQLSKLKNHSESK